MHLLINSSMPVFNKIHSVIYKIRIHWVNHWQHSHRTKTLLAWTCILDGSPASTTTSVILGSSCRYKRGPGRPRTIWRGIIKKDLKKMKLMASSVSSSQQTRMASVCDSVRPLESGMNQGQGQGYIERDSRKEKFSPWWCISHNCSSSVFLQLVISAFHNYV